MWISHQDVQEQEASYAVLIMNDLSKLSIVTEIVYLAEHDEKTHLV